MKIIGYTDAKPSHFFKKNGHLLVLGLIAVLSFGLNFYAISRIGFGNAYYAAAIKSMTQSFHNFFFVSFDPAGVVTVDKPPLGLWVQALFVMAFGYHGWAMLLPQALAGAASSVMMYVLTARHFGRPAGLISALVFAVTPAVVVASRNNTMDMQLVFVLLIATWFLFRSIEKGKWRYLFLAALFVGIGFNVKMLEAYLILPAAAIVYLIFAKEKFMKRLAAGLISVLIAGVVSFAWVAAVDLTPASAVKTEITVSGAIRRTETPSVPAAAICRILTGTAAAARTGRPETAKTGFSEAGTAARAEERATISVRPAYCGSGRAAFTGRVPG